MRTITVALLAGLGSALAPLMLPVTLIEAHAADLDYGVLRGPEYEPAPQVINWSGTYFGAHAGYSSAALGFRNVFQPALADYFKNRDIESEFGVSTYLTAPSRRVGGTSYGGFAGYNIQFDDIVIGVEADYTRFDKAGISANAIGRQVTTAAGITDTVDLAGSSTTKIEDFGTIRARAGYVIGNLMPFVTGGLAIGRATISDNISVQNYGYSQTTYQQNQTLVGGSPSYVYNHGYTTFNQKYPGNGSTPAGGGVQTVPAPAVALPLTTKSKAVGGVTLGGGLEYALTQNILLRGEYQYVLFNDFDGHKANLNTVRGGAAVKF